MIKVVYIRTDELKMLRDFFCGVIPANNTSQEIINYLFKNFFIIENDSDDKIIYNKCLSLIPQPTISNAYIVVTENCNFNCKYCFISDIVQKDVPSKVMSYETARKAVELLQRTYERQQENYNKTITFYGGEPLLNFNTVTYFMEEINRQRSLGNYWPSDVKYALITNGALLTNQILDVLKQYNIALSISYDIDKVAHSNRISKNNDNSFLTVKEKIELCKKKKHPFGLSITISNETIDNRVFIIDEIKRISPMTVAFNMLIPSKYGTPPNSYYEKATDFMIEAFKELRMVGIYEDRVMRKVQSFESGKLFIYDCCASGGNQFVINPSGEIGICHGYLNNNKYFSSNVSDQTFDFRNNDDFIYWKNRTPLKMAQCSECECIGICGGGCPYAADFMHKSIYAVDNRFCIHAKKILHWMIEDLYHQMR